MKREFINLREQIGSRSEVATLLGISHSQIESVEQGRRDVRALHIYALRYLVVHPEIWQQAGEDRSNPSIG